MVLKIFNHIRNAIKSHPRLQTIFILPSFDLETSFQDQKTAKEKLSRVRCHIGTPLYEVAMYSGGPLWYMLADDISLILVHFSGTRYDASSSLWDKDTFPIDHSDISL